MKKDYKPFYPFKCAKNLERFALQDLTGNKDYSFYCLTLANGYYMPQGSSASQNKPLLNLKKKKCFQYGMCVATSVPLIY